ncbi:hypothetical protein Clos_2558 [Alkaliphilus oremlandii OhILAs]|uniref:Uncharacterized protein n=2 Tax=Alkaliphilus oremlandii TaxID=461876 RepID=A8MJV7_ALKOO|nr:hypothetical protein Clos_2558 [Alkaliphilus oremlandii OhILAs]
MGLKFTLSYIIKLGYNKLCDQNIITLLGGGQMFKIMTRADKILIAFILIASIGSIFTIPKLLNTTDAVKEVVVFIANQEVARFELVQSSESIFKEVPFTIAGKEYAAKFEMKDGRVMLHRLPEEIVPLSIHKEMGWISESYQMIVALPIKMYATIENNTNAVDTDFDIIVQ